MSYPGNLSHEAFMESLRARIFTESEIVDRIATCPKGSKELADLSIAVGELWPEGTVPASIRNAIRAQHSLPPA